MKTLTLTLAACLLSACASSAFDSEKPVQLAYLLNPPALEAPAGEAMPVDLMVARPTVRPGLDTDRIAALYPDRRLDYLARSRWGGDTDVVVQNLLVDSLRGTGQLRTVQSDLSTFVAEFVLQTEVRDFQAEYGSGGAPVAHITLLCGVGRIKERRALASFTASGNVQAEDNTLTAVVAAFEKAYQQAAQTVVTETLSAVRGSTPAKAP